MPGSAKVRCRRTSHADNDGGTSSHAMELTSVQLGSDTMVQAETGMLGEQREDGELKMAADVRMEGLMCFFLFFF